MCGICGTYGFSDGQLLRRMCEVLQHRGPDDEGVFLDNKISLGNRRLSIIDVEGGHQPIHNEDQSVWITFNGEIYNYRSLREDLKNRGHRFRTQSDTEVIVHLYEDEGESCVNRLVGMFSFAIWDSSLKKMLLARDRLGVKPLYYCVRGDQVLFSSEVKSILQFDEIERRVNLRALDRYLTLRYVNGPDTLFEGIYKLQPAHTLTIQNDHIRLKRYWDIPSGITVSSEEAVRSFLECLIESVRMRLISDVPLGLFLSGGLDSSAILALMSELSDEPVNTFSIGFGLESDELDNAQRIAEYFGANHREFSVKLDEMDQLPKLIWYLDEPLADPTIIPTFLISRLAARYVKVVLSGEGADELFAGYFHEKSMIWADRHGGLVKAAARLVPSLPVRLLDVLFEYPSSMGQEGKHRMSHVLRSVDDESLSYSLLVSAFRDEEKGDLYSDDLARAIGPAAKSRRIFAPFFAGPGDISHKMLLVDTQLWLPDYILARLDKMSMANSIEAREPFLDHRLVELCSRMPNSLKMRGSSDKHILREAMRKRLPEDVRRRPKRTFITPIHEWAEKELLDLCSNLLDESAVRRRGYFKYSAMRRIFEKYFQSKLIVGRQLWTLITLEIWHRVYIESDRVSVPGDNMIG